MPIFSNIDDIGRWLHSVVADFNFDRPGIDKSIGVDAANAVAYGIEARSADKQQGAEVSWPENSEPYKSRKDAKYGTTLTNFRTGQMLSHESLTANLGTIDGGKTMVMQYGTGTAPTTSKTGHIEDADKLVTDTEKASYAHDLGRPFFEVDETIDTENVMPIVGEGLTKYLQERADR